MVSSDIGIDMKEILIQIREWVLHLFNPHCDECARESECKNCDYLRLMIEQERAEKTRILGMMMHEEHQTENVDPFQSVKRFTPWNAKRQQLEQASREESRRRKANGSGISRETTESPNGSDSESTD